MDFLQSEDFSTGRKDDKPADTEVVVPDVGRVPVPPDGGWGWVVCIGNFRFYPGTQTNIFLSLSLSLSI